MSAVDLIYYLFMPLILVLVLCILDLLLVHLSFTSGAGSVCINFSYYNVLYRSYQVNNKVIDVPFIYKYCYTGTL